jgi:hypothetical protein
MSTAQTVRDIIEASRYLVLATPDHRIAVPLSGPA